MELVTAYLPAVDMLSIYPLARLCLVTYVSMCIRLTVCVVNWFKVVSIRCCAQACLWVPSSSVPCYPIVVSRRNYALSHGFVTSSLPTSIMKFSEGWEYSEGWSCRFIEAVAWSYIAWGYWSSTLMTRKVDCVGGLTVWSSYVHFLAFYMCIP